MVIAIFFGVISIKCSYENYIDEQISYVCTPITRIGGYFSVFYMMNISTKEVYTDYHNRRTLNGKIIIYKWK